MLHFWCRHIFSSLSLSSDVFLFVLKVCRLPVPHSLHIINKNTSECFKKAAFITSFLASVRHLIFDKTNFWIGRAAQSVHNFSQRFCEPGICWSDCSYWRFCGPFHKLRNFPDSPNAFFFILIYTKYAYLTIQHVMHVAAISIPAFLCLKTNIESLVYANSLAQ